MAELEQSTGEQDEGASSSTAAYAQVIARVGEAAKAAHRDPTSVDLIVVSKTFASDRIAPILAAGHRSFGENRVQEAQGKWPDLKAAYPDTQLHLIGPLQSNKAADAVTLFDVIHTVDRPKIAAALAREMARQQRSPALFVQVNTGEEPQKAGVMPADTVAFVETCRREHALAPVGLMCIPPVDEEASIHFAFLAELAERCGLSALSMGMSADFETAISFGATHVRVGSAVFGAR